MNILITGAGLIGPHAAFRKRGHADFFEFPENQNVPFT